MLITLYKCRTIYTMSCIIHTSFVQASLLVVPPSYTPSCYFASKKSFLASTFITKSLSSHLCPISWGVSPVEIVPKNVSVHTFTTESGDYANSNAVNNPMLITVQW